MGGVTEASLEPKLLDAALAVLRRHGVAEDELAVETPDKPNVPHFTQMRAHRIRVHVDAHTATFEVRGSRWSGARPDYPSAGAFVAALESELHRALSKDAA